MVLAVLFHRVVLLMAAVVARWAFPATAADFPAPQSGTWIARDFKFHTGEVGRGAGGAMQHEYRLAAG